MPSFHIPFDPTLSAWLCSCHYTHFPANSALVKQSFTSCLPALSHLSSSLPSSDAFCLDCYTDYLWQLEMWQTALCLTLSPSLCVSLLSRCISKLPPWPSLSACPPLCLWGCSTCPRSTSSSSTPSRTYPNENAALRWGGRFDWFNLISNKSYNLWNMI